MLSSAGGLRQTQGRRRLQSAEGERKPGMEISVGREKTVTATCQAGIRSGASSSVAESLEKTVWGRACRRSKENECGASLRGGLRKEPGARHAEPAEGSVCRAQAPSGQPVPGAIPPLPWTVTRVCHSVAVPPGEGLRLTCRAQDARS